MNTGVLNIQEGKGGDGVVIISYYTSLLSKIIGVSFSSISKVAGLAAASISKVSGTAN